MNGITGIFLQVRLSSTRLPGKALLPLEDRTIISHAMESLREIPAKCHVVVTDHDSISALSFDAAASDFKIFAGPRDDVLKRFVMAADFFGVDTIIRATGDNPLVDSASAMLILESHLAASADYSGFDGPPIGTGVEILSTAALKTADLSTSEPYNREHVSPYLYRNPEKFRINRIQAPSSFCLPDSPVTIDTRDDYEYIQMMYKEIYKGEPLKLHDIIPWLEQNRRQG